MQKLFVIILGLTALLSTLNSCKPEVDLNNDYKNIPVVYGLLNITEPIQYLKIYKGYLSQGNALEDAKIADSLYFFKKIDVFLDEYSDYSCTQFIRKIEMDTTTAVPKDSGIFANPTQLLYCTDVKLNENNYYKLSVIHKETGEAVTGKTSIVPKFTFITPMPNPAMGDNISTTEIDIASLRVNETGFVQKNGTVKFNAPKNSLIYDIFVNFYYTEEDITSGTSKNENIRFKLGRVKKTSSTSEETITLPYICHDIYRAISNSIAPNPNVIRYFDRLKFEIFAAGEDYSEYIILNSPSGSLVQDRLKYTNLESQDNSALGLFSSQGYSYLICDGIKASSMDSLIRGSLSKELNFKRR